jgi:hypothetical protein
MDPQALREQQQLQRQQALALAQQQRAGGAAAALGAHASARLMPGLAVPAAPAEDQDVAPDEELVEVGTPSWVERAVVFLRDLTEASGDAKTHMCRGYEQQEAGYLEKHQSTACAEGGWQMMLPMKGSASLSPRD